MWPRRAAKPTYRRPHAAAAAAAARLLLLRVSLALCCATHGASQDGKLPLHYAAAKGASFEVTELLLNANPEAAAVADKARP